MDRPQVIEQVASQPSSAEGSMRILEWLLAALAFAAALLLGLVH